MRVAIVGGGFSGTMAAVQLARLGRTEAVLVERRVRVAAGAAYSTDAPFHLLNVRAKNMSPFPEAPDHFLAWVSREGLGGPETFVPRRDYRRYLEGLLRQAEATGKVRRVRARAVALDEDADGLVLTLEPAQRLGFDRAVLAGGNQPSRLPAMLDLPAERRVDDPWGEDGAAALRRLADAAGDVLLLGTGLTMVDVALSLAEAGFGGKMVAVSRRGLVPRPHDETGAEPLAGQPPARLGALMRQLRREARQAGWRPAVDGLRPHAIRLWRGFGEEERRRFLRHARPWWDVHRHRIAPAAAAAIDALKRDGRLEVAAGRIAAARAADEAGLDLTIARRGGGELRLRVAAAVNCTGPEGEIKRIEDPLTCWLLASGLARADPLGIGLDVDHESRLIDADGKPSGALFALGPPTRGTFWEIVAVPDIREQARGVARLISAY